MPVRYGGATIGALSRVRWTLGSSPIPMSSGGRGADDGGGGRGAGRRRRSLARRRGPSADAGNELLGVSAAMAEVRRAVERAATAPFPVLIEGESGSGKELVARAIHDAARGATGRSAR